MEFWGVEVKPGETVKCEPGEDKLLHLSQAALGESKGKGVESVPIFVKFNDQKLVLGTLSAEKCAQISYDIVFEKEFELSHSSKNTSIYFCGYKSVLPDEDEGFPSDDEGFPESESEEDIQIAPNANGKAKVKEQASKPGTVKANAVKENNAAAKPKAKAVEPIKADKPKADEEDESDDDEDEDDSEDESDDDEDMLEAMSDTDDEDEDESSEEDEATPKKAADGKKRPAESASKTPVPEKKAKLVTPGGQKTGGDAKKGVHVATPHPAKQAGKTPANADKSKQQNPKSPGSVTCKSCSRSFNSENALQAHSKAKHSDGK